MFVGAINQDLRSVLAGLAPAWKGLPVYVGCSGNATIERILATLGFTDLHGNDISLYSCALGRYLAGEPFYVTLKDDSDPEYNWLDTYLAPGLPTVATLLLCTTAFQFAGRDNPYHRRMWNAYRKRFPELHAETLEKLTKGTDGVRLASFFAGDVVDHLTNAPEESVVVSFPPTYKSGYERLYKKIDAVFAWDAPEYQLFTEERLAQLLEAMQTKRHWLVSRDHEVPALAPYQVARVQSSMGAKPVYVYSSQKGSVLTTHRRKYEPIDLPRVNQTPAPPLTIIPITEGQLNTLRSEYLSVNILPGTAGLQYVVLVGGYLAGAFAFKRFERVHTDWHDVYMLTDFAVASPVPRLSKLVLAAILSREVKGLLEQAFSRRIKTIGTTAFTDKPASMKYRGLFTLHSSKPGQLNYVAEAGRWTLAEGFQWWTKHHRKAMA